MPHHKMHITRFIFFQLARQPTRPIRELKAKAQVDRAAIEKQLKKQKMTS
jgi:hypothetical protein